MKTFRHFANVSKDQLRQYQKRSTETVRSETLAKAWGNADILKDQYKSGIKVTSIAKYWNINVRAAYRIIKGK